MPIRILATADIHIGRRPTRLANPDDAHRFSAARMWEAIVERALEEKVDLVALAGDIVDHDNRFFLRPQEPPHESRSLVASLQLDGKAVTIDYDLGRIHCQRDGMDHDCPSLAPAEMGDRYVLALHDLIRSEDGSDFAAEIIRESAGGYDANAAKESLGFKDRASGKGKSYKELEAAVECSRKAQKRQDELRNKDRELRGLRQQREEAQRAANQIEWLDKAIRCHEVKEAHEQALQALGTFPEGLAQLTGREVEDLERLQGLLEEAREKLVKSQQKAEIAKKQMADSRLPEDGVTPGLIGELRLKCQKLRQMADRIQAKQRERSEAAEKAGYARQALGSVSDAGRLGRWDADIIDELAKFARRAERTRAEKHAIDSLIEWLQVGADDEPPGDPEMLNQAIRLLHRWLAYEEDQPTRFAARRVLLVTAGITVVSSIAMALLVHWSWVGHRELRIAGALVEGAARLRTATQLTDGDLCRPQGVTTITSADCCARVRVASSR
ncbi:MAG: hypothetical protein ACC645_19270, partial [Pirellulales bacterium]